MPPSVPCQREIDTTAHHASGGQASRPPVAVFRLRAMALATRCPHCGTAFKLVRDQLLLRQGWVRCGRCGEAFNAADHAFEPTFERPHPISPASLGPEPAPSQQTTWPVPVSAPAVADGPPGSETAAPAPSSIEAAYRAAIATALPVVATPAHPVVESIGRSSPWQSGAFAYSIPVPAFLIPADSTESVTTTLSPEPQAALQASEHDTVAESAPAAFIQAETNEGDSQRLSEAETEAPLRQPSMPGSGDAAWAGQDVLPAMEWIQVQAGTASLGAAPEVRAAPDHPAEIAGSEDDTLATFSAEAEAALRHEGETAAAPPPAPFEELLRAAKEEALLAEADRAPQPASQGARPELDPSRETDAVPTDAGPGETDTRFDLGAVLHYEFGPDTGVGSEIGAGTPEPELIPDAMAAHGDGVAPAQLLIPDTRTHARPELLDGVVAEPGFLRQARAQERWQQPGVRASLAAAVMLLIAMGAAQAAWTWRDALAAKWPQSRSLLAHLCHVADCSLAAPRRPQSLVIDTSSMSPQGDGLLQLDASLRNRSDASVAYPALELTLIGAQDQIVVRKVIQPAQYLASDKLANGANALQQRIQRGLAAGAELRIRLQLQLRKDHASGYTLYAFYP